MSEAHIEAVMKYDSTWASKTLLATLEVLQSTHAMIQRLGAKTRLRKVIEEAAELIVAIRHYEDDRASCAEVIAEMADVLIAVLQADYCLQQSDSAPEGLYSALDKKLARLNEYLAQKAINDAHRFVDVFAMKEEKCRD